MSADGTRRIAELARDGRPLLVDLTEGATVAAAVGGRITVAAGVAVGEVAATALLVRPERLCGVGISAATPDGDEIRHLSRVLAKWFGIRTATSN